MIKVIAMDMDGTLLNSNHVISSKTKEVLLKAQQKGIHLILASGRPLPGLKHQADVIGLDKNNLSYLAYNGAIMVDALSDEVYFSDTLELDLANRLIQHFKTLNVNLMINENEILHVSSKDGVNAQHEADSNGCILKENTFEKIDFRPHKILISEEQSRLDSMIPLLTEPFKDEVDFVKSAPFYLECLIKGENKGKGLKHFCELKGIPLEEVIAFGDNYNDEQLIETAGIGVAMGNAVQRLKDIADIVTTSNDEDGIAKVLLERGIV